MRRDMAKVLVERPRLGAGWGRKGRTPAEHEELPRSLGMHGAGVRPHRTKMLNENLAPLRRFLEGQVNRPWDKVWSELREHVKPGNTVQEHVLLHVGDFVALHVEKVPPSDAAPCGLLMKPGARWRFGAGRGVPERKLYVDPDDGLLKRAKRRRIPKLGG